MHFACDSELAIYKDMRRKHTDERKSTQSAATKKNIRNGINCIFVDVKSFECWPDAVSKPFRFIFTLNI